MLHQRCLNCSWNASETPYAPICNYNIRVTIEMVLLSIFYTNQIHEGSADRLYSFCRSMRLFLHLAVKILLQIFLYEDLSTLALHTSVGCIPEHSRTALCYATNTIK